MLFREDIEPRCDYCRHVTDLGGGEFVCVKKGIVARGEKCGKFRYDPLKREPEPRERLRKTDLSREDFEL